MAYVQDRCIAGSYESIAITPSAATKGTAGWARLAAQLAGAPVGFVTVADGDDWTTSGVDQAPGRGPELTLTQRVVADAIAQHVSVRSTALVLPDARKFWCGPDTSPTLAAIRALLAVPVFTTGRLRPAAVIGAMDIRVRGWTDSHQSNLDTLGIALAHAMASD